MKLSAPHERSGFTLTELLVVIAIMGGLAVLITPALQGAFVRSKSMKCQSNLRQIGIGILGYASDNNGYLPVDTNAGASADNWGRLIRDYIPTSSEDKIVNHVFRCPGEPTQPPAGYDAKSVNQYTTTYAVAAPGPNGKITSITNGPRKTIGISSPSKTLLVVDGVLRPGEYSCFSSRTFTHVSADTKKAKAADAAHISFRHGDSMNVLYADGHVGNIKWVDRGTITKADWNGTNN